MDQMDCAAIQGGFDRLEKLVNRILMKLHKEKCESPTPGEE